MIHNWTGATDGNGATVRVILFDYQKAFDFIDHAILVQKLTTLEIPRSIVNWIIDFLSDRLQRVKLVDSCYSEWGSVPSEVPQGTKLGTWLFAIMNNDLEINNGEYWTFVDDTTASETVAKGESSNAQLIADEVVQWSTRNRLKLNSDKCKELRISFSKKDQNFPAISINGKEIEVATNVKLLGLTVSNNLKWNEHINGIVKKANKRMYFLIQFKRTMVPVVDLKSFYITCIRSVLDYGVSRVSLCASKIFDERFRESPKKGLVNYMSTF